MEKKKTRKHQEGSKQDLEFAQHVEHAWKECEKGKFTSKGAKEFKKEI